MINRRELLLGSATAGAALMSGCFSRRTSWEFFTEYEALTLAALSDQIIPADEFPSASEAGAVMFIDRQLVRHYHPHQQAYRDGLALADQMSRTRFGTEIAKASSSQQYEVAVAMEKQAPEFFNLVRSHTLQGYYGSPRHGGNRDAVSWRMLGLAEPPLRGRAQYDLTQNAPAAGSKS